MLADFGVLIIAIIYRTMELHFEYLKNIYIYIKTWVASSILNAKHEEYLIQKGKNEELDHSNTATTKGVKITTNTGEHNQ